MNIKTLLIFTALSVSFSIFSDPRNLDRLKQMDFNKNGEISYEEFNISALERFTLLDANGDGIITEEEFIRPVVERFKKIDSNTDEVLSKKEIRKALKQMRKDKKRNIRNEKKRPQPFIKH